MERDEAAEPGKQGDQTGIESPAPGSSGGDDAAGAHAAGTGSEASHPGPVPSQCAAGALLCQQFAPFQSEGDQDTRPLFDPGTQQPVVQYEVPLRDDEADRCRRPPGR